MWGREQPGILVLQITLLVLIRKFHIDCLKDTFLEKAEIAIKSWFAVVGANILHFGPVISFFFNEAYRITENRELGAPRNSSPVPLVYKRGN